MPLLVCPPTPSEDQVRGGRKGEHWKDTPPPPQGLASASMFHEGGAIVWTSGAAAASCSREKREGDEREETRVEGEGEPQRSWLTGEVPLLYCCFRSLAERSRRSGAWYLRDLLCAR